MMGRKFTDDEIVKALDICDKLNFFYGQRAGYELWFVKPVEVQDRDVKQFAEDMQFVKSVINRQKAEIDRLNKEVDRLSQCVLYHEGDIIDAFKEFAVRLCDGRVSNDPVVIAAKALLKELTEDKP